MGELIRYAYDPQWSFIAAVSGAAVFLGGLFVANARPIWLVLGPAVFLAICAILALARRLAFRRFIVIDEQGIIVPGGFMRAHPRRVLFIDVVAAWQAILPLGPVFCIQARSDMVEVHANFLADLSLYREICSTIISRVPPLREGQGILAAGVSVSQSRSLRHLAALGLVATLLTPALTVSFYVLLAPGFAASDTPGLLLWLLPALSLRALPFVAVAGAALLFTVRKRSAFVLAAALVLCAGIGATFGFIASNSPHVSRALAGGAGALSFLAVAAICAICLAGRSAA